MTSIIDFGKHFCPGALQFPCDSLCESGSNPTLRQEGAFGAGTSPPADRNRRVRKGEKEREREGEGESAEGNRITEP